ncbi:MAG TPA: hypothetical protein VIT41_17165 [Microlunatus sp.]
MDHRPVTRILFSGEVHHFRLARQDWRPRLGLGNRLLNFYLYAGGLNQPLERDPRRPGGDGIDRIAFTGEEHGFAAPVGPTGRPNRSHAALAETVQLLNAVEAEAAAMVPHHDLTLGFVSDDYLTEHLPPDDGATAAIHADRAAFRGFGARQIWLGRWCSVASGWTRSTCRRTRTWS